MIFGLPVFEILFRVKSGHKTVDIHFKKSFQDDVKISVFSIHKIEFKSLQHDFWKLLDCASIKVKLVHSACFPYNFGTLISMPYVVHVRLQFQIFTYEIGNCQCTCNHNVFMCKLRRSNFIFRAIENIYLNWLHIYLTILGGFLDK